MSRLLKTWRAEDVTDVHSFAEYCEQRLGCPWPTYKDKILLQKKCNDLFKRYPDRVTWQTMVRVANWMRSRKWRPARVWMVAEAFREAWSAGALPELDPRHDTDETLERQIQEALKEETRMDWRRMLLGSSGLHARREVYECWKADVAVTASTRT